MDLEEEKSLAAGCLEVLLDTNKETLKWWAKERPEKFQALKAILDATLQGETLEIEEVNKAGDEIRFYSEEDRHEVLYEDIAGYEVTFHCGTREDAHKLFKALLLVKEIDAD